MTNTILSLSIDFLIALCFVFKKIEFLNSWFGSELCNILSNQSQGTINLIEPNFVIFVSLIIFRREVFGISILEDDFPLIFFCSLLTYYFLFSNKWWYSIFTYYFFGAFARENVSDNINHL